MADINARTRLLIGTTAEWAAADLVLGAGELVLERAGGTVKMKAGDGAAHYSALPFVTAQPTIPPEYLTDVEADALYLKLVDVTSTPVAGKVPRLGAGGLLHAGMVPLPPAIDVSTGAADAGKLVKTASTGKVDATLLPPTVVVSAGPADAGKHVVTSSTGKVDSSLITVTTGTYRGTVDATLAKPAGTYLAGDYFLNTGSGLAHASWGFPGGTTVSPSQQIIYNGTAWDTVQGAAYLPISGGQLTGVLKIRDGGVYGGTFTGGWDALVAESNGDTGISIMTPKANYGGLVFGNPTSAAAGFFVYGHAQDVMQFGTGGTVRMNLSAAGGLASTVPFYAPNGTLAAPSYTFNGDPGAGLVLGGGGTTVVVGSGAELARFTPTASYLGGNGNGLLGIQNSSQILYMLAGTAAEVTNCAQLVLTGTTFANPRAAFLRSDTTMFTNAAGSLEYGRFNSVGQFLVGTSVPMLTGAGRGEIDINGTAEAILGLGVNGVVKAYVLAAGGELNIHNTTAANFNLQVNGATKLTISPTQLLDQINGEEIGWRNLPVVAVTAAGSYSFTIANRGKCVNAGGSCTGVTIGDLGAGAVHSVFNGTAGPININAAGVQLFWNGTVVSTARTLAKWGFATMLNLGNGAIMLTGQGIS
jgi:hypothetical protein